MYLCVFYIPSNKLPALILVKDTSSIRLRLLYGNIDASGVFTIIFMSLYSGKITASSFISLFILLLLLSFFAYF